MEELKNETIPTNQLEIDFTQGPIFIDNKGTELKLTEEEVLTIADNLIDFYRDLTTIQDYFLERKKEKIEQIESEKYIKDMFWDYTMEPKDMNLVVEPMDGQTFNTMTQLITSLPLESQIGRQVMLGVKEKDSNKWVGFIRVASPVLNIKPRNNYFGEIVRATQVNKHMINGAIIVPVQPFGYNYLGGKLLALIACSHEVRQMLIDKYGEKIDPCFLETTSLYGDLKGVSQYDGLRPFIKYQDMTESDVFLFPTEKVYLPIREKLRSLYGRSEWGNMVVDPVPSGPKMREFNKIISLIKNTLKYYNPEKFKIFSDFTKTHMKAKTKKRYYYSEFGYSNVKEHVLSNGTIPLERGQNYDKHTIPYIMEWWRNKAQKRYEKLVSEDRLRLDLEVYTKETIGDKKIDIVR
jgi:hypothetical protein